MAVAWVLHRPVFTAAFIGPRNVVRLEYLLPPADIPLIEDDLRFCDSLVGPGQHVSGHFKPAGGRVFNKFLRQPSDIHHREHRFTRAIEPKKEERGIQWNHLDNQSAGRPGFGIDFGQADRR
jgi:hypothetical protein